MRYLCVIYSDFSRGREYEVYNRSAMKAALELGRCEGGEVVTVAQIRDHKVLSRVVWSPELKQYHYANPRRLEYV